MPDEPQSALLAAILEQTAYIKNLARDIQTIRGELIKVVNYMHEAESEIPEKMRRFMMYFHDAHDMQNFYHEQGQQAPPWLIREVERGADRFRHLVEDLEKPGEAFEQVRREMAQRPDNRYDHTRYLPKEVNHAPAPSSPQPVGPQSGTDHPREEHGLRSQHRAADSPDQAGPGPIPNG